MECNLILGKCLLLIKSYNFVLKLKNIFLIVKLIVDIFKKLKIILFSYFLGYN